MKNKILSLVLAICLILPCSFIFTACKDKEPEPAAIDVWDGTVADVSQANEGVITIDSAEELAGLAYAVNEGTSYEDITIKLECDIDLNNREWIPIGYGNSEANGTLNAGNRFNGVFDGQNHIIKNLKITEFVGGAKDNNAAATGVGLFGAIFDATIKNLKIEDATVEGNHFVGVVAGHARGSVLKNIEVEDATVSCVCLDEDESGDKAGVIVAFIGISPSNGSLVEDCSAEDCDVDADRDAGQLIGSLAILDIKYTGTSNRAEQRNNTVDDVVVTCNNSSINLSGYTKRGQNIKNEIVGRIVDFTSENFVYINVATMQELNNALLNNAANKIIVLQADFDLKDVNDNKSLIIDQGKHTIDLNGHKITGVDDGKANWHAIRVQGAETELVIMDSSVEKTGTIDGRCYGIQVSRGAKLTINGGNFVCTTNPTFNQCVVVYGGTLVINNGTFTSKIDEIIYGKNYTWDSVPYANSITINGGTYNHIGEEESEYCLFYLEGTDQIVVINGGTFNNNKLDYVVGYDSTVDFTNNAGISEELIDRWEIE